MAYKNKLQKGDRIRLVLPNSKQVDATVVEAGRGTALIKRDDYNIDNHVIYKRHTDHCWGANELKGDIFLLLAKTQTHKYNLHDKVLIGYKRGHLGRIGTIINVTMDYKAHEIYYKVAVKTADGIRNSDYRESSLQPYKEIITMDLRETKIEVKNEEESKLVQEYAFKCGYTWCGSITIQNTNKKYLYFDLDKYITYGVLSGSFIRNNYREININNIETKTKTQNEETKMELKDMKTVNLKEAKRQVNEEKKNAEILEAKNKLIYAQDNVDRIDRRIKRYKEERKPYEEILAQFK